MDESPFDQPIDSGMFDGADVLARLDTVERRLAGHASRGAPAGLTEPDPDTPEERWEAGQVWAHIAEFVPYWHGQLRTVIAEYDGTPVAFGRTKADPGRIAAIEVGRAEPIADHMERTTEAITQLKRDIGAFTPAEWNAVGVHPTRGELDVEAILERFIVEHLEEHADQLDSLG
jgi:hypothetical protein